MKSIKFLMSVLLCMFVLAGCDTDDLKNDLHELTNRVESLEAQVSSMNDNMNALRVFVDGKKTIQSWSLDEKGNYNITLSDGDVLHIAQGKQGSVATPSISISEDGYWVINGEKQSVKAKGENAFTPQFQIDSNTKFWQVKLSDAAGFVNVTDSEGNPVKAVADEAAGAGDAFFTDVKVEGDTMKVTYKDGTVYSLPIAEDLACEIVTDGVKEFAEGVLSLGYGQSVKLTVKVKGENYFVTAPMGWTAVLGEPNPQTNEAELTVTAPAAAKAFVTRAVADNTKDLTVQVNKGLNWAVDKIQVSAQTMVNSYKALYDAGESLTIAGYTINKETYGEAAYVDSENFEFKDKQIYFIKPGIDVNYHSVENFDKLILIGDNPSQKSCLKPTKQIKLSDATNKDGFFLCENLNIDASKVENKNKVTYLLAQNGNSAFKNAHFHNCKLTLPEDQPLTYISTSSRSFTSFTVESCSLDFAPTSKSQFLISLGGSTATYGTIIFKNNVMYSTGDKTLVSKFKLFNGNKATIEKMVIERNTFVNMATETTFMVYVKELKDVVVQNNLVFFNADLSNVSGLLRAENSIPGSVCDKNIVFKTAKEKWQIFFGGIKKGFEGAVEAEEIKVNPFDGGTFNLAAGTFVPGTAYAEYGAKLD